MKTTALILPAIIVCAASCSTTPDYDATGIFEATTVTVSSQTSGPILSFPVAEGDSVNARQTIAVIDTAILVLQQKQVEHRRQSAESSRPDIAAQAASLRSQIAHQQSECERLERLIADGAATRKQLDDARAALRTLRATLDAQLSTLTKNRSSISDNAAELQYRTDEIAQLIDRSTVTSPLSGTILVKYAEPGEYATPGKPLVKIADLDNIYLRSYFTASQLSDISVGRPVTVIADFGGDKKYEYPGTVTWIADESEFTPKSIQTDDSRANLVYAVKISVKNDGRLKIGQYGEVRL